MNVLPTMAAVNMTAQITRVPSYALAIGDISWKQMGNLAKVRTLHTVNIFIPACSDR